MLESNKHSNVYSYELEDMHDDDDDMVKILACLIIVLINKIINVPS